MPVQSHSSGEVLAEDVIERYFLFALIWSVGGILETGDRNRVDQHLRSICKKLPEVSSPTIGGDGDTIYEYRVPDGTGIWQHWGTRVPVWDPPADVEKIGDLLDRKSVV